MLGTSKFVDKVGFFFFLIVCAWGVHVYSTFYVKYLFRSVQQGEFPQTEQSRAASSQIKIQKGMGNPATQKLLSFLQGTKLQG